MTTFGIDRSGAGLSGTVAEGTFTKILLNDNQAVGAGSFITLQAPDISASWTLSLPVDDGTANQFLQTDGAGVTSWASASTGDLATQYALLAGRASSQILRGGVAASETLALRGTSHATVGLVALNDLGGNVTVGGGTTASELRFLEPSASGTNYTGFAAAAQTATIAHTLPAALAEQSGNVLSSTTAGVLAWDGIPVGTVWAYAGTSEPAGWVFCYGQAISRTTYAALFAILSTTFGIGDGSTTFNVPDLRGRVVAGQDDMGGSSANRLTNVTGGIDGDVFGSTGGAESHTLLTAQLPAHTHAYGVSLLASDGTTAGSGVNVSASLSADATSSSTGSDTAHNNVQPTIILNYMIKT